MRFNVISFMLQSTGPSSNNTSIITVDANESYRFRLVNSFCGTCSAILTIEGHSLIVIATDGRPIKPTVVNSIVSFAGTSRINNLNNIEKDIADYLLHYLNYLIL